MSVERQQPRVAFQGERGAFGEEAAVALLGPGVRLVPRPTFEETFGAVGEGEADCALVPISKARSSSRVRSCTRLRTTSSAAAARAPKQSESSSRTPRRSPSAKSFSQSTRTSDASSPTTRRRACAAW